MASRAPNTNLYGYSEQQNVRSLLLNPPGSRFSSSDDGGCALLVPVSQNKPAHDDKSGESNVDDLLEAHLSSASSPPVSSFLPPSASPATADASAVPGLPSPTVVTYSPVHPHWFYCKVIEKKKLWFPFSLLDSVHLEEEYQRLDQHDIHVVATDGGRYDVYIHDRIRCAVYWEEDPMPIRRATWFFKLEGDRSYAPYPEHFADKLEEEYSVAIKCNTWHRRLEFPEGETVVIHNPEVIVHYQPAGSNDWEGVPEGNVKPRVVKRGMDDFGNVEDGEAMQIDHLVFVVHGIGAICDLKFRTLPEAVGDFRMIANSLLLSHFQSHVDSHRVGRVEFLPVSWHSFLHGDATGIDNKLKPITLKSIPKLRYFANDSILDVLFYTSPVYAQAIVNQVGSEINRLYALFLKRNPAFSGKVSLAGHSLGSVILFDLLYHQQSFKSDSEEKSMGSPDSDRSNQTFETRTAQGGTTQPSADVIGIKAFEEAKSACSVEEALGYLGLGDFVDVFHKENMDMETLALCTEDDIKGLGLPLGPRKKLMAFVQKLKEVNEKQTGVESFIPSPLSMEQDGLRVRRRRRQSEATVNYMIGVAGTGHPCVIYPRLDFQPTCFFAIGSPIAMFLTVRGHDTVWDDYKLPTCPAFYNIFHPYDPVAYRVEPLIDPDFNFKPVLIPHHKGRKRMHLEIKESLSRVGADFRQKVVDSFRSTWNTINEFARAHRASIAISEIETDDNFPEGGFSRRQSQVEDDLQSTMSLHDQKEEDYIIGQLNGGRRIDYVLQEKPIESFNEYLFALGSHTCYWESEDTVLLMLKEVYASYGIHPSSQGPEPPKVWFTPMNSYRSQTKTDGESSTNKFCSAVSVAAPTSTVQSICPPPPSSVSAYPSVLHDITAMVSTAPSSACATSVSSSVIGVCPNLPTGSGTSMAPPPLAGFVNQSAFRR